MMALVLALTLAGYPAGVFAGQNHASRPYSLQVGHVVTLSWQASTTSNVTYNVYFGTISGGPYTRVNSSPITGLTYQDLGAIAGNTYYYVATAVDSSGNESVYSNEIKVTIPTP
jgi:fibronectin type 3 domain-containing protein